VAFTAEMPSRDCDTIRREFWGEAERERVYWELSGGCGSEDEEGKQAVAGRAAKHDEWS
jgi:hypothetical protein